ncbi:subtilisin-like protease SBT3.9 [Typha angustifolia]|uniref:subtilisin-like protease SBT3.9 n=1 Tax=Typha angustifolia TaxID=59011 RepID=UPI003C2C1AD2
MRNPKYSNATLLLVVFVVVSIAMAEASTKPQASPEAESSVYIVYLNRPEGVDPEAFHLRTLASVLGSEAAAKDAVIYHYMHAASGFSAKLTPKQVEDLKAQPDVLQVVPSRTYQLHGSTTAHGMGTF